MTYQHLTSTIPGHFDEDEQQQDTIVPILIYPQCDNYNNNNDVDMHVQQVAVGWGTTAVLTRNGTLQLVGRPHDVMSLLRLQRMPIWMRNWTIRQQFLLQQTPTTDPGMEAVTPIGRAISSLIGWASGYEHEDNATWQIAKRYSYLSDWTTLDGRMTRNEPYYTQIACGPGFMAMIGQDGGSLYTMGVNNRGQCGIGQLTNHVWTPQPVRGLSMKSSKSSQTEPMTDINEKTNVKTDQDQPIVQVALGFQHGYALAQDGHVYSWGKAQRGQLGRQCEYDQDPWAGLIRMKDKVLQIAAGHHHGASLTEHGEVYLWGKNMAILPVVSESKDDNHSQRPQDAMLPQKVPGMDGRGKIIRISCGSHHTAMLLEDGSVYAVGIASDQAVPILNEPVLLIPEGLLELPLRQFEAHFDRTTVVDSTGTNVLQAHLWFDETLRDYAYFTPPYVDALLEELEAREAGNKTSSATDVPTTIQSIHRGWRHTVIVTTT